MERRELLALAGLHVSNLVGLHSFVQLHRCDVPFRLAHGWQPIHKRPELVAPAGGRRSNGRQPFGRSVALDLALSTGRVMRGHYVGLLEPRRYDFDAWVTGLEFELLGYLCNYVVAWRPREEDSDCED